MNEKVAPGANLRAVVERASGAHPTAKTELTRLAEMGALLAAILPEMATKTTHLVQAGEKLVAGAPGALTNPKFAMHLGLVKQGLTTSILVVKESGSAMVGLGKDLRPFKKPPPCQGITTPLAFFKSVNKCLPTESRFHAERGRSLAPRRTKKHTHERHETLSGPRGRSRGIRSSFAPGAEWGSDRGSHTRFALLATKPRSLRAVRGRESRTGPHSARARFGVVGPKTAGRPD